METSLAQEKILQVDLGTWMENGFIFLEITEVWQTAICTSYTLCEFQKYRSEIIKSNFSSFSRHIDCPSNLLRRYIRLHERIYPTSKSTWRDLVKGSINSIVIQPCSPPPLVYEEYCSGRSPFQNTIDGIKFGETVISKSKKDHHLAVLVCHSHTFSDISKLTNRFTHEQIAAFLFKCAISKIEERFTRLDKLVIKMFPFWTPLGIHQDSWFFGFVSSFLRSSIKCNEIHIEIHPPSDFMTLDLNKLMKSTQKIPYLLEDVEQFLSSQRCEPTMCVLM